jgi:hypothetical protein
MTLEFWADYQSRTGLINKYKENALLLYTLELYTGVDDIDSVAIVSFHKDPRLAYNEKKSIWNNDKTYSKYFNENLKAGHIIFCFSLLKSLEEYKRQLSSPPVISRQAGMYGLYCQGVIKCD